MAKIQNEIVVDVDTIYDSLSTSEKHEMITLIIENGDFLNSVYDSFGDDDKERLSDKLEEDNSNWDLVEEIIDEEFLLDPNGTTERLLLKLNELGMLKDSELEMLGIKVVK